MVNPYIMISRSRRLLEDVQERSPSMRERALLQDLKHSLMGVVSDPSFNDMDREECAITAAMIIDRLVQEILEETPWHIAYALEPSPLVHRHNNIRGLSRSSFDGNNSKSAIATPTPLGEWIGTEII